ncbi:hypothetical protein PENTCL1PPCAC_10514, partial [Pristionchus entomophagus]
GNYRVRSVPVKSPKWFKDTVHSTPRQIVLLAAVITGAVFAGFYFNDWPKGAFFIPYICALTAFLSILTALIIGCRKDGEELASAMLLITTTLLLILTANLSITFAENQSLLMASRAIALSLALPFMGCCVARGGPVYITVVLIAVLPSILVSNFYAGLPTPVRTMLVSPAVLLMAFEALILICRCSSKTVSVQLKESALVWFRFLL